MDYCEIVWMNENNEAIDCQIYEQDVQFPEKLLFTEDTAYIICTAYTLKDGMYDSERQLVDVGADDAHVMVYVAGENDVLLQKNIYLEKAVD